MAGLPPEQQRIRDQCFHPSGTFVEFKKDDVEQSIPSRFEEQVRQYPNRLAIKTRNKELTYDEINKYSNQVARAILHQLGGAADPIRPLYWSSPMNSRILLSPSGFITRMPGKEVLQVSYGKLVHRLYTLHVSAGKIM